jgi:hypothetical protein
VAGDLSVTDGPELRFKDNPPAYSDGMAATAMLASSEYRMPMPSTVDILYPDGRRRQLWMTASPLDDETSRSSWYVCRTGDLSGDDRDHLAFQAVVTAVDEPVASAHVPAALALEACAALSGRTDTMSIAYRRWLKELAVAALSGPSADAGALGRPMTGTLSVMNPEAAPEGAAVAKRPGADGAKSGDAASFDLSAVRAAEKTDVHDPRARAAHQEAWERHGWATRSR